MKDMKSFISLLVSFVLLFTIAGNTNGQSRITESKNPISAAYVSLDGHALSKGNQPDTNGNIRKFNSPVLHLIRTKSNSLKGTILLLPGGDYKILNVKNEGENIARFFNAERFDVVILEYHIASGQQTQDLALIDAIKAFRLIKTDRESLGLHGDHLVIMGLTSGGHLAARTLQKLDEKEQPNDLILISPSYLNETITGTVIPAVMPPIKPTARLFVSFFANDNKVWIQSGEEYSKTWKGYDGQSAFNLLTDSASVTDKDSNRLDSKFKLLLKTFLEANLK